MITLLLVDDDPIVRRGLRMRLALEPDLRIVGEANDGEEALARAEELRPDVVVMDVVMLHLDGISATAALRARLPQTRVVILSLHGDPDTRARAAEAGAVAFITKSNGAKELLVAIRSAATHGAEAEASPKP
jgi:DNA-binding NarL/FixJ family response regulator